MDDRISQIEIEIDQDINISDEFSNALKLSEEHSIIEDIMVSLRPDDVSEKLVVNYINLSRCNEKRLSFEKLYTNNPFFNIKRFEAIDTSSYVGCGLSHKKIIMTHNFDVQPILIVAEDDLLLLPEFEVYFSHVISWARNNLDKWTLINCGDIRADSAKFDNNNNFIASVSFSLNLQFMLYSKEMVKYISTYNPAIDGTIDVWIGYNVPNKKSTFPILTVQKDGYSEIESKYKENPSLYFANSNFEKALKEII